MPQPITPAMVTALASKLQVGAAKRIQGELEIDYVTSVLAGTGIAITKSAGNPTGNFDAMPEDIVKIGSTYYTTYRAPLSGPVYVVGLAHASSPEGPWTSDGTILSRNGSGWEAGTAGIDTSSLFVSGGTIYLFYSIDNGDIGVATTSTATPAGPYVKDGGNPILSRGAGGAWDSGFVRGPSITDDGVGGWVMAYSGALAGSVATSEQIGYATASSLTGPWAKAAANPIVAHGGVGSWDDVIVGHPRIWFDTDALGGAGAWAMLYTGAAGAGGASPGPGFPWGLGIATAASLDGPWAKNVHNPFIPPGGTGTWDAGGAFRGGIFLESSVYYLIYAGFNGAGTAAKLGTATLVFTPSSDPVTTTLRLQVEDVNLDRGRKLAAAQLDVVIGNADGTRGYYRQAIPIFAPNNQCRAYAWYGDRANRVRVFTGLLDRVTDHRDPDVNTIDLKARSRTKLLLAPHVFTTSAPQGAGEKGAVRTEANGVFLNRAPEYIAAAVLDLAGWPTADRDLGVSGVVIPEYDLSDGGAWLDQIAGVSKLTTIAGWDVGEDELGVFHFGPNLLAETSEPTADWIFGPGLNVLAYDHQVDDEERVTRVRVSGPMASTVPVWKQEWSTSVLKHPTGAWYNPAASAYLYVVDGVTQDLYKIRQSDRKVVAKWPLAASLSYAPIGLSADPTDPDVFWVLDADWRFGLTTHAKLRKFDAGTKALLATHSLPDGQWSDMKTDGSHIWLTNFGDDKLYRRTMTGASSANFSYPGHTNPTGMYLNGTTIGLFFNGGQAFYLIDTAAPGTITGTQSTKGTHIEGGEADTTTDVDLYAVASAGDFGNAAGYVWKFALAEQITVDVVKWATDQALEDELGVQAGLASRVHDLHPLDAAHPWERRDKLVTLETVNSEAQAAAVAAAVLAIAKRLRRTLDLATIGNPAIQIGDAAEYPDTVADTDAIWMVDSKRERLEGSAYVTSMSVLPWEAP